MPLEAVLSLLLHPVISMGKQFRVEVQSLLTSNISEQGTCFRQYQLRSCIDGVITSMQVCNVQFSF